ncbi:hypothetical protein ACFSUS_28505 [Spirosoma soli]|uniref:Uncharacterized protein n=1 Tax=Spirosoma soli TaxID=1770529 RepID=A0ABW5MDZ9_9BACT
MRIQQKRIQSPQTFLHSLPTGSRFQVILTNIEAHSARLQKIGFSSELRPGEKLLPKVVGPISRFNADGKDVPQKDQPKETCYRTVFTRVFGRSWQYVTRSYERYPRVHYKAPEVELTIDVRDGQKVLISTELEYQLNQMDEIKHTINLFLELFGECDILSEVLVQLHAFNIERRNWRVLPQGEYPWEKAKDVLQSVTKTLPAWKREIVDARFKLVTNFSPSRIVIGEAGFDGYVIFCFEQQNLYLLESRYTGNATYVFGENWERLSTLTKQEILNGKLHQDRIVHTEGWPMKISGLFPNRPDSADNQQAA